MHKKSFILLSTILSLLLISSTVFAAARPPARIIPKKITIQSPYPNIWLMCAYMENGQFLVPITNNLRPGTSIDVPVMIYKNNVYWQQESGQLYKISGISCWQMENQRNFSKTLTSQEILNGTYTFPVGFSH